MAATVSVAQRTLLIKRTSDKVIVLKIYLLRNDNINASKMKPKMVPTTPKNVMMPKF